jgi:hypothetical protein
MTMTIRRQIILDVLEAAKDAGAVEYIGMCRRLLVLDRMGWRKMVIGNPEASAMWVKVRTFADNA